jgi:hypothetical protein
MHVRHWLIAAFLVHVLAQTGWAQGTNGQPRDEAPAAPPSAAAPAVDVSRLPIDLQRIQRSLEQSSRVREERDGLNLRYFVDVFAEGPQIELFTEQDNLRTGPVPFGAPTHREMLYMMTPPEFRSPVMDFSGLIRWLSDKSKK